MTLKDKNKQYITANLSIPVGGFSDFIRRNFSQDESLHLIFALANQIQTIRERDLEDEQTRACVGCLASVLSKFMIPFGNQQREDLIKNIKEDFNLEIDTKFPSAEEGTH